MDSAAGRQTVRFIVLDDHAHFRVDAYLAMNLPWRSRRSLVAFIRSGAVTVNGRLVDKKSHRLAPGDSVSITVPRSADADFDLGSLPLQIVWEDDDLVVVNKSGDLAVHPASTCQYRNLQRRLIHHYRHEQPDARVVPSVVHRLDRTTSGVVVFAKRRDLVDFYTRQFAARTTTKEYVAIVHGRVEEPLVLEGPIHVPDASLCWVGEGGKPSRTDVHPMEATTEHSRVAITLHTGRRHQIRVHLAHEGHPLVWDGQYGDERTRASWPEHARALLHAQRLSLDHRDGRRLSFTAAVPDDMEHAWAELRQRAQTSTPP